MVTQKQNRTEKSTKKTVVEETKNLSAAKQLVGTRGRVFEGTVVKKFATRVVIEAERTVYHHKFERFFKKKMRMHARLPLGIDVNVGDYIRVRECRPLSKIIHSVVIEVVRKAVQVVSTNSEAKK